MWHETREEMMEMLKSILRMDEDQCARRVAQKYLRVVDPDYYEFESKWHNILTTNFEMKNYGIIKFWDKKRLKLRTTWKDIFL